MPTRRRLIPDAVFDPVRAAMIISELRVLAQKEKYDDLAFLLAMAGAECELLAGPSARASADKAAGRAAGDALLQAE